MAGAFGSARCRHPQSADHGATAIRLGTAALLCFALLYFALLLLGDLRRLGARRDGPRHRDALSTLRRVADSRSDGTVIKAEAVTSSVRRYVGALDFQGFETNLR